MLACETHLPALPVLTCINARCVPVLDKHASHLTLTKLKGHPHPLHIARWFSKAVRYQPIIITSRIANSSRPRMILAGIRMK